MAKVIGIDLGTTNSCVAVMEGGEPVVINRHGKPAVAVVPIDMLLRLESLQDAADGKAAR